MDSTGLAQNFKFMNTSCYSCYSCYSCRESIKRPKLHKKHIIEKHYDCTGVPDISVFYPDIPLPMVFDKFKENLLAGILKGKFDRRLRR